LDSWCSLQEAVACAGWAADAAHAGPKMAALIAAATEPAPDASYVTLNSDGVVLTQTPSGGTPEPKGYVVTIVVGKFAVPGPP